MAVQHAANCDVRDTCDLCDIHHSWCSTHDLDSHSGRFSLFADRPTARARLGHARTIDVDLHSCTGPGGVEEPFPVRTANGPASTGDAGP